MWPMFELPWRDMEMPAKESRELIGIVETQLEGDLFYTHGGGTKEMTGLGGDKTHDGRLCREPCRTLDDGIEVVGVHVKRPRIKRDGTFPVVMLADQVVELIDNV